MDTQRRNLGRRVVAALLLAAGLGGCVYAPPYAYDPYYYPTYSYPTYSYPAYTYPTYGYPAYVGPPVTLGFGLGYYHHYHHPYRGHGHYGGHGRYGWGHGGRRH